MTHPAKSFSSTHLTAALSFALVALPSMAQQAPDAGRLLQQDRAAPTLPKYSTGIQIAPPTSATSALGGTKVALKAVRFTGNTLFSNAQLTALLNGNATDITTKPFDLAGLQVLAQRVSEHYRAAGYPFARALIPEQNFSDGVLHIAVIEGRYGKVQSAGDDAPLVLKADRFLSSLVPGSVISAAALERATLILDDQPGIGTLAVIRPGTAIGTGDLEVRVKRTTPFSADLSLDNHGNHYTGEYRARVNLQLNSPFTLGDQVTVRGGVSDERQWLGNLGYSLPLGASGLRANIGYAHSSYELAKQFSSLNATGTADIASLGLSYPMIRSQRVNLSLAGTFQDKILNDQQRTTNTQVDKKSQVVPLTLQFDRRDSLGGGGITFGSLGFASGQLDLDMTQQISDAKSANTQGNFSKWSLDIARIQATPQSKLSFYGRLSTQWASKNLDSSEDFGLGGPNGVRAYPGSEGFGDEGWLMQIEARYQIGSVAPYTFYDAGRVVTNKSPWVVGSNDRELSGYGVGLRYNVNSWSVDASLAWRDRGGPSSADTTDTNPRLWLAARWRL